MAVPQAWSSKEVCDILGISYRQLDLWIRSKLLTPSISQGHGSGSARRFSFEDLVRLALIRQLLAAGMSLRHIKIGMEYLSAYELTPEQFAEAILVTDGEEYFALHYSDRELDKALKQALQRGCPILTLTFRHLFEEFQQLGMPEAKRVRTRESTRERVVEKITEGVTRALTKLGRNARAALTIKRILDEILETTGAPFGEIFLRDVQTDRLYLAAYRGPDGQPLHNEQEYKVGERLPGLIAQTGEPIVRTYLGGEPRFMRRAARKGIRFSAGVPLKVGDRVIGTIHIAHPDPQFYP